MRHRFENFICHLITSTIPRPLNYTEIYNNPRGKTGTRTIKISDLELTPEELQILDNAFRVVFASDFLKIRCMVFKTLCTKAEPPRFIDGIKTVVTLKNHAIFNRNYIQWNRCQKAKHEKLCST